MDSAGDVFAVANGAEPLIDVYSPSGEFKTSFGAGEVEGEELTSIAIDAAGRVYVASTAANAVYVFKPEGGPFGTYSLVATWTGANLFEHEFAEVKGVAVDTSTEPKTDPHAGDIYVLEGNPARVTAFSPPAKESEEGKPVAELLGHPEFAEVKAITVRSSTGQVYVAAEAAEKLQIQIFGGAGNFEGKVLGAKTPPKDFGNITGLAVDEGTGDIYVVDHEDGVVNEFNAAHEWIGWLTASESSGAPQPLLEPLGVAVAPAGATKGDVYITDPAQQDHGCLRAQHNRPRRGNRQSVESDTPDGGAQRNDQDRRQSIEVLLRIR